MKRWSQEDSQWLIEHYSDTPYRDLMQILNRPYDSIFYKASKLGLHKNGRPGYLRPAEMNKYTVNAHAFDDLSPQTTYVLGFIFADGNVQPGRFKISNTNLDVLQKIRLALKADWLIHVERRSVHFWYDLTIVNKHMTQSLERWGVVPNKSLVAICPELPLEYQSHFIRGYFDGDGGVRYDRRSGLIVKFTSGSPNFLNGISHLISHNLGIPLSVPRCDKNCVNAWRIYYFGPTALALAGWMYRDADELYHTGKHAVFNDYRHRSTVHLTPESARP